MKFFKIVFGSLLVTLFAGCASDGKWQAEEIPYPRNTPFDRNQFARQAFLDGFRMGYRAEMHQGSQAVDVLGGPYLNARQIGYHAGVARARSELYGTDEGTSTPAQ